MRTMKFVVCLTGLALLLLILSTDVAKAGGNSRSATPAATTTYTGTIATAFTITIVSSLSTKDTIACAVRTTVDDSSGTFKEIAEVAATRTGSTATCTVPVPYSWTLASPSSDTVSLEFDVIVPDTVITSNTVPARESTRSSSIALPANGATTDLAVDVTI